MAFNKTDSPTGDGSSSTGKGGGKGGRNSNDRPKGNSNDSYIGHTKSLASTSVMFIFIYVYIHIYAIGIHDSYWTDGDENETPRCFYPNCLRLTVLILLIIYPIDFFYSELSLRIYVCFSS